MSRLPTVRRLLQRTKVLWLVLAFLIVFGSVPLVVNVATFVGRERAVLARQEQEKLTHRLELLRTRAVGEIESMASHMDQVAGGLGSLSLDQALDPETDRWVRKYLVSFQERASDRYATRVVDLVNGRAQRSAVPEIQEALDMGLDAIRNQDSAARWDLLDLGPSRDPIVLFSVPVYLADGRTLGWVLQGVLELPIEGREQGDIFLIDLATTAQVVWASTPTEPIRRGAEQSGVVRAFMSLPSERDLIPVMEYETRVGADLEEMLGQVARLGDTGWAILVQQPRARAFFEVRRLLTSSIWSAALMLLVAFLAAVLAARMFTVPLEKLAKTAHQISHGRFGERVEPVAFGAEMAELADSFNAMSGQIAEHIRQLRQAAQINRELFIGSIRSFLAAIEAKEPYTRGHSERVASYSQAVARHLSLSREFQERIWIAGLMHDVGKIGIDDRVLKKGDKLTDEEYAEMKRHPVIGAEIMASIEQLKDMLPAIRWHHEDWAGTGYPDALTGEEIPLMARIVAVADTFDAITTQRVYQDPYSDEEAVGIIQKLIGKRFDPKVAEAFIHAFQVGDIDRGHGARPAQPQPVSRETQAVHS